MRKPFDIPKTLEELCGPSAGKITLSPMIYWGPTHDFNVTNRDEARTAYEHILTEGSLSEMRTFLNRDLLIDVWCDLFLPTYIAVAWENRFEPLKGNKACLIRT